MYVIPTNLVCVLFDPTIPTSSFNNYFQLFLYFFFIEFTLHGLLIQLAMVQRNSVEDGR